MNKNEELRAYLHELAIQINAHAPSKEKMQQLIYAIQSLSLELSKGAGYDRNKQSALEKHFEKKSKKTLQELEEKQKSGTRFLYIQEQMKEIVSKIQTFWNEQGFYYVGNIESDNNGNIEVEFAFALGFPSMNTKKKISGKIEEQKNKAYFLKEGYRLNQKENGFLDCDSNKEKIATIIQKRFPSSYIRSWETSMSGRNEQKIKRVYIRIPDVLDI